MSRKCGESNVVSKKKMHQVSLQIFWRVHFQGAEQRPGRGRTEAIAPRALSGVPRGARRYQTGGRLDRVATDHSSKITSCGGLFPNLHQYETRVSFSASSLWSSWECSCSLLDISPACSIWRAPQSHRVCLSRLLRDRLSDPDEAL